MGDVTRTTASFTITTNGAADYAYAVLPASETIADAEALFENGTVAMFEGAKKAEVKIEDLSGDTEYKLYAAARNLNPFLYSELVSESIDTHVAYTDMITLPSPTTISLQTLSVLPRILMQVLSVRKRPRTKLTFSRPPFSTRAAIVRIFTPIWSLSS